MMDIVVRCAQCGALFQAGDTDPLSPEDASMLLPGDTVPFGRCPVDGGPMLPPGPQVASVQAAVVRAFRVDEMPAAAEPEEACRRCSERVFFELGLDPDEAPVAVGYRPSGGGLFLLVGGEEFRFPAVRGPAGYAAFTAALAGAIDACLTRERNLRSVDRLMERVEPYLSAPSTRAASPVVEAIWPDLSQLFSAFHSLLGNEKVPETISL